MSQTFRLNARGKVTRHENRQAEGEVRAIANRRAACGRCEDRDIQLGICPGKRGTFILRVEDTEPMSSTEENTRVILDAMRWLGLDWDEGPYFQSE